MSSRSFSLEERRLIYIEEISIRLELNPDFFESLVDRDIYIIYHHMGFGGEIPMTLEEIGNKFGISRQRVHVLMGKTIHTLRERANPSINRGSTGSVQSLDGLDNPDVPF